MRDYEVPRTRARFVTEEDNALKFALATHALGGEAFQM